MIKAFSHFCFVSSDIEADSNFCLANGYEYKFERQVIANPLCKQRWSYQFTEMHELSLLIHASMPPIELIKYPRPTKFSSLARNELDLSRLRDVPLPGLLEDAASRSFVNDFFAPVGARGIYQYKSRFSKSKINFDFYQKEFIAKHIDVPGVMYPAFWVDGFSKLSQYFANEQISEEFCVTIDGRAIEGCVVSIQPGVYLEFLKL